MRIIFISILFYVVFFTLRFIAEIIHKREISTDKLKDPNWEIRLETIKKLEEILRHKKDTKTIDLLLETLKEDENPHIKSEIVELLDEYLSSIASILSRPITLRSLGKKKIVDALINALNDENCGVRERAAKALRHTNAIHSIPPLLAALSDKNENVRQSAAITLEHACTAVDKVVFGSSDEGKTSRQKHALYNPDVSKLTTQMPALEEIIIDVETCNPSQVEAFAKYILTYLDTQNLKEFGTVRIIGEPFRFNSHVYDAFNKCKHVDVSIEIVIFGIQKITAYSPSISAYNPDVPTLTIPMSRLKRIDIYVETCDFQQVERFLTYAIDYVGPKHLKKRVNVHIYGKQSKLHPNIYNNIQNLCNHIIVHI